jgi:hypothetical protein
MEWYMFLVYGVLVIGAISSYLNYKLQKKWFDITHNESNLHKHNTKD